MNIKWWGYLHTNGSIQVKRYFDNEDFDDADSSTFVERRTSYFEAASRDEAILIVTKNLKK